MASSFKYDSDNSIDESHFETNKNEEEKHLAKHFKSIQVKEANNEIQASTTEGETYLLPSEIDWKDYIYYLPQSESEDNRRNGGKWLLFAFGDQDKVDHRWIVLQRLCDNGKLYRLKSSTAFDTVEGVTMCYTCNSENKEEVKIAADEIRKLINYEYILFYKTNEASASGKYQDAGNREISVFMHTLRGGFYERDSYMRWKKIHI